MIHLLGQFAQWGPTSDWYLAASHQKSGVLRYCIQTVDD